LTGKEFLLWLAVRRRGRLKRSPCSALSASRKIIQLKKIGVTHRENLS
jgi:hypothetical protein